MSKSTTGADVWSGMVMLFPLFDRVVLPRKSERFEAQGSFWAHRDGLLGRRDVLVGPEDLLEEHRVAGVVAVDDLGGAAVTQTVSRTRRPVHDESARSVLGLGVVDGHGRQSSPVTMGGGLFPSSGNIIATRANVPPSVVGSVTPEM